MLSKKRLFISAVVTVILSTNIVRADEYTLTNETNKIYSIAEGTSTDYNFNIVDKNGNTNYYKINLNIDNIGQTERIIWSLDSSDGTAINIELPNGETKTIYYKYSQPNNDTPNTSTDINTDYILKYNNVTTSSYDATGGALSNNTDVNSITSVFLGNINSSTLTNAYGGALYNSGNISHIIADFIRNTTISHYVNKISAGGAIYNNNYIGNIMGSFVSNGVSAYATPPVAYGGAIFNSGNINTIIANFINNYLNDENTLAKDFGGAIYNSGNIKILKGDFINNYITASNGSYAYGGAIYNSGTIESIEGDFIGNNLSRHVQVSSKGGAIYNTTDNGLGLKNNKFIGNYAYSTYNAGAKGGAIYTDKNLILKADSGTTLFTGNYVVNSSGTDSQAIYVDSSIAQLTLNTINNGEIIFDDKISGVEGYGLNITGDITSSVTLNNDIENANATLTDTNLYMSEGAFNNNKTTLTTTSGTVHFANGETENYQINQLNSNADANYTIDVDTSDTLAPVPDKITTGNGSSGTVKISEINVTNNTDGFTTQVLYAQDDDIQLDLSDELKNGTTTVSTEYTSDEMRKDVKWNETFNSYKQDTTTTSSYGLATTNTTNDSITFNTTSTTGEKTFIGTNGDTLALINQYETTEDRNFSFDNSTDLYNVSDNLGTTASGILNINGVANENGRSTIDGKGYDLFKLDNETTLNLNNVKVTNAQSVVTGTNTNAEINLNNAEIVDNTNGIKTAGNVTVKGNSTISNNGEGIEVTSNSSVITLDATDSVITLNDKIKGVNGSKLNLKGGIINIAKKISVLDINMDNTNTNLQNDNVFNGADLTVKNQSSLNMANNATNTMYLNSLTLNDNLNMNVDVDLANRSMDRIIASNYSLNDHFINVTGMNLLSDSDSLITKILFADNNLKDNVTTSVSEVAYSPIWKYGVNYDKLTGQFIFTRSGDGNDGKNLNPAVMVSPVSAQLGGYMGMLNTYEHAFNNMDIRMMNPANIRLTEKMLNKYAISDTKNVKYVGNNGGTWLRPFASYDSVGLKNGYNVNNFSYGSFFGGDTGLHELKRGYSGVLSAHISYLGSHQSFSGNSIYQNGGNFGVTGTLYKGNFFTGLSINTGASIADASTMYGNEDFPMLMAGIASKTGYNIEFKEGKFIIQPSFLISYTMVNAFNYTNKAGVKINSDPLHAIQISPNLRFIMNTKNGWQPYATVGMMWNVLDETKFTANNVNLPELSIRPYVQYGLGIQKNIGDRFTAYGQVVVRNGGRNGIAGHFGGRYLLGIDLPKEEI